MRELRVPARADVDSAVTLILDLNPAIRVRKQNAILAGKLGRRFRISASART